MVRLALSLWLRRYRARPAPGGFSVAWLSRASAHRSPLTRCAAAAADSCAAVPLKPSFLGCVLQVPLLPALGLGFGHADVSANLFFLAVTGIDPDPGNIVMVSAHNVSVNG